MESIQQACVTADFGGDAVATISRNGDLVHRMYLEAAVVFRHVEQGKGWILD